MNDKLRICKSKCPKDYWKIINNVPAKTTSNGNQCNIDTVSFLHHFKIMNSTSGAPDRHQDGPDLKNWMTLA